MVRYPNQTAGIPFPSTVVTSVERVKGGKDYGDAVGECVGDSSAKLCAETKAVCMYFSISSTPLFHASYPLPCALF